MQRAEYGPDLLFRREGERGEVAPDRLVLGTGQQQHLGVLDGSTGPADLLVVGDRGRWCAKMGHEAEVGLMPTEHPYLYAISASVAEGKSLSAVEDAVLAEVERLRRDGITPAEHAKVNAQLRARFVYDADSVTDIAHQTRLLRDHRVVARLLDAARAPRRRDAGARARRRHALPHRREPDDRVV